MSDFPKVLPPVARNISLPCKKCAMDRFHVVTAHVDSRTAKVKCEVCGSRKTYKIPSEAAKMRALSSKSRKVTPTQSAGDLWRDLNAKIGSNSPLPYRLQHRFYVQTAIQHPKFGLGFITFASYNKIEVVFQDVARALVHNRAV